MLVDSHTHIYMRQFDADRDVVIQRTFESGIGAILSVGIDRESSRDSVKLAHKYPGVFATVGFHPHDSIAFSEEACTELAQLGREPKVVAVGEIGLDFYRDLSPRDVQLEAFRRQLELAVQLDLPVIIHDRDAHKEIMGVLRQWIASSSSPRRRLRGVIHCFSGDLAMARECIDMGFLISIAGPVTYPNSTRLAEIVNRLPLESLLVETDCPFLTPHPYRTKRNEPLNVRMVAEKIAELKGIEIEVVAEATTNNAKTLFNLTLQAPPA